MGVCMEKPIPLRQKIGETGEQLIIFFDTKGIDHKELLLVGKTVISTYCCDVLQWVHENLRRNRSEI
jgi:hypothetical protein